jgi:hypothetical protein
MAQNSRIRNIIRHDWPWIVGLPPAAAGLAAAATLRPAIIVAVLGGVVLLVAFLRNSNVASALILIAAIPLMRPFLMGERLSLVADAMVLTAAFLSFIADAGTGRRMGRDVRSLLLYVSLLWLWLLAALAFKSQQSVGDMARGLVNVPIALAAAMVVLRDRQRRVWVTKGILVLVLLVSASFVVTLAIWLVRGFGFGQLTAVAASYKGAFVPVYFPFTPTLSAQQAFGSTGVPRFVGLGREPGVMAALSAWAFFMLPRIGWTKKRWRILALAGMLGTASTAGFGTFVVVLVAVTMFTHSGPPNLNAVSRQLIGVFGLGAAGWLAVFAPTFGLATKADVNPDSFNARFEASRLGLASVVHHPLGQDAGTFASAGASAINLIAATALIGVPGVLLVIGAYYFPWRNSAVRVAAAAPVAVVFLTVLLSQPPAESTGFFMLVGLATGGLILGPLGEHARAGPVQAELEDQTLPSTVLAIHRSM